MTTDLEIRDFETMFPTNDYADTHIWTDEDETTAIIAYLTYDQDAPNPRKEFDQFGKMVCWHDRYNLGDEHYDDSTTPREWLAELAAEIDPTVWSRIEYWESGRGYIQCLNQSNGNYDRADDLAESRREKIIDKALKDCIIIPLYLYDHSGITIKASPFSCPWDSGQVGYIYATPEMIRKEYGKLNKATREQARNRMLAEVEEYDTYLTGDVHCMVVETHRYCEECETWKMEDYDVVGEFFGMQYAEEDLKETFAGKVAEHQETMITA